MQEAVSNIFARKSVGSDSVACTPEHPFFVNNTWREAKDLKQGDSLFAYSGYKVALDSINTYKTDTATTVYNLEASGNHNFYVSASGVLVHNKNAFKHSFKYASRVYKRAMQDPKSHNFPYSFDDLILKTKPSLKNNGYKIFQLEGQMNGKKGVFEIGLDKNGIIDHRFFRPVK